MVNRTPTQKPVASLHEAVDALDWNVWSSALESALTGLSPVRMLSLAESVIRDELSAYEKRHPDDVWARRVLDRQEVAATPPESTMPGGNSFLAAVEQLADARAHTHNATSCRDDVVQAINNAVMSAMDVAWGDTFPVRWRQWYDEGYSDQPIRYRCGDDPIAGWDTHPLVVNVQRTRWREVTRRIAAAWHAVEESGDDV